MVAWSALVGSGRLWSALVGCGRRRRCTIVNRSRSDSVRGSGGCLVGSRRRCSIVNGSRSGSRGSGGCLVGCGRLWSGVDAGDAVPL